MGFLVLKIMAATVFAPCLEAVKHVKTEQGDFQTMAFLNLCKQLSPILDKFGTGMAVVKSEIRGNISRLDNKYNSNTMRFNYLYSLVQDEVEMKTAKASSSCTSGLLWLTRTMDFLVEMFQNLAEHQDWTMGQCCNDAYGKTLKKWHGWLASSSFAVGLKLIPDRKKFMEIIGKDGDVYGDVQKLCTEFIPILTEIHKFLASCGMDELRCL